MRMMNIASGSSGNATYVGNDHTHILIDSGVSRKKITEGLKKLDLSLDDLTAILITHEHSDHISSLAMLQKTVPIPVYTTKGTADVLTGQSILVEESGLIHVIRHDETFRVGDMTVTAIRISHDAKDPVCYRLTDGKVGCAVVTDLGEFDESLIAQLKGLNAIMLESNHDVRMLEAGPYPYSLKMRIAGNKGHLSNESSGQMLSKLLHDGLQYVVLGHLSRKNNNEELARLSVAYEIDRSDTGYHSSDFCIDVASQTAGTKTYVF